MKRSHPLFQGEFGWMTSRFSRCFNEVRVLHAGTQLPAAGASNSTGVRASSARAGPGSWWRRGPEGVTEVPLHEGEACCGSVSQGRQTPIRRRPRRAEFGLRERRRETRRRGRSNPSLVAGTPRRSLYPHPRAFRMNERTRGAQAAGRQTTVVFVPKKVAPPAGVEKRRGSCFTYIYASCVVTHSVLSPYVI